jgi:hypothetical protein
MKAERSPPTSIRWQAIQVAVSLIYHFDREALTDQKLCLHYAFLVILQQMNQIAWALKLYKHTIYRNYSQALLGQNEDSSAPLLACAANRGGESILFQIEVKYPS